MSGTVDTKPCPSRPTTISASTARKTGRDAEKNHQRSEVNKVYEETCTIPPVKHGGVFLMIQGCVSYKGTGILVKIGKLSAAFHQAAVISIISPKAVNGTHLVLPTQQ